MNDDYISGLRKDLVAAAARQQQTGRAARVARPLRPRAWSPLAVLGAAATAATVLVVVLGIRAILPAPQPADPKILATFHIGAQPRDAVAVGGALLVADYGGNIVRIDTPDGNARWQLRVGGTPVSIEADGNAVWVMTIDAAARPARSNLLKLDSRSGRELARIPVRGYGDAIATGAGGLWVNADLHTGGIARIDLRSFERTAFIPGAETAGLAATERTLWTRHLDSVFERDERGRVINRVDGISPTLGFTSQRTLLADADGAWVVGQSDGQLYRIEHGRVVQRLAVGQTAGVIARAGSDIWVSAGSGVDRYELVRVDPEEGKVTGRLDLGSRVPQTIVPVGKQLWVVTSTGDVLRVNPG